VGPKKALALVREYGTAYDIAANLPITSKYKYIQNLNAFGAENLMLNYKLMDLMEFCDEAIGPENCKKVNHVLEKYLNGIAN
jgi:5'-3' exonuclease